MLSLPIFDQGGTNVEIVAGELFDKMQRSWFLLDIYPCGILLPNLLNFSVIMLLIV